MIALAIVTVLTVLGFGVLLPGEARIYLEMVASDPDPAVISRYGLRNARLSGVQGVFQLAIIVVMVYLRWGVGSDQSKHAPDRMKELYSDGCSGRYARSGDRCDGVRWRASRSRTDLKRVVYLDGLGRECVRLSAHLRSRHEIEAILETDNYGLTTLRAAVIIGDGGASFEIIRQLVEHLPSICVLPLPTAVDTDCQPIAIDDVIAYLTGVLDAPETNGMTFDIGGPEILTYRDLLQRTACAHGRFLFVVSVPWVSERVSVYWISRLTDVPETTASPLVRGLDNTVVVRNGDIDEYVSVEQTPIDEAIERAITDD